MDVGAIGEAMMGGAAVAAPAGPPATEAGDVSGAQMSGVSGATLGATGASSPASATALSGAVTPQMQNLINALQGFTSAEILMALMLLAGSEKKSSGGCASAAMGLLAGMAIAGQLGQIASNIGHAIPGVGGCGMDAGAGAQINVQA